MEITAVFLNHVRVVYLAHLKLANGQVRRLKGDFCVP